MPIAWVQASTETGREGDLRVERLSPSLSADGVGVGVWRQELERDGRQGGHFALKLAASNSNPLSGRKIEFLRGNLT